MNELSLTIIRVAFLAVLWLFVIAAIGVVRTDLLGGPSTTARRSNMLRSRVGVSIDMRVLLQAAVEAGVEAAVRGEGAAARKLPVRSAVHF